jgi:hypothetical protein
MGVVMNRIIILLFILISAVFLSGCTGSDYAEISTEPQVEVSAEELYSDITSNGGYKGWALFPGTEEFASSAGVHGDKVSIYASSGAYAAIEGEESVMPYESIIIKEGFNSENQLEELVVMYKVEGYDPAHNDWFWALYLPGGAVSAEGKISGCINCHEKKSSNDFIFTGA